MTASESLIETYLRSEMVAEGLIVRDAGDYVFQGDRNDYLVEVKVFDLGPRTTATRLKED